MKSELMKRIMSVVSEVCEVSEDLIRSMRKNEYIVEARSIFVVACMEYGLPAETIAAYLNRKRVISVYDSARNYQTYHRQSYSFRLQCAEVSSKLSELYPRSQRL